MMPTLSTLPATRIARALAKSSVAAAIALPALLPGMVHADTAPVPPQVPTAIKVPAGNVAFLLGHATGTQNYECRLSGASYAWTLVAPQATLVDDKGKQIITHYGGPSWEARDGSKVVGEMVDGVTVSTTAIDWLLVRAVSTSVGPTGGDRLAATTYIQRVNTTGGMKPASGCDASTAGATAKVPYASDYYFFKAA
jgi:hypothetical protein